MSPSDSAPVTVTSLNVEPGSYVSVTERFPHERLPSGPAGERAVVLDLETLEPLVVDTRVADHLRRDRSLRVGAPLLLVEADAGEVPLREERRLRGAREPLHVDELAAL